MRRGRVTGLAILVCFLSFAAAAAGPLIELSAGEVLHDEEVRIVVAGCGPWQRVTLRLSSSFRGKPFVSEAAFISDVNGRVDVAARAPVAGSYSGVDPMGLFWSMREAPDAEPAETPPETQPWEVPPPQVYELTVVLDDKEVASETIKRVIVPEDMEVRRLNDGRLRGALFLPEGDGPHPAVLVLSGSGGGYLADISGMLAGRGFAALALAYFAAPDLPDQLAEIPLEYFEEGLEWLAAVPEVDGQRIGVMGRSRGGELALILGSISPRIRAVVSVVPSHVMWGGCCDDESFAKAAWTRKGEPLPSMPETETYRRAQRHWEPARGHLASTWLILANEAAEAQATIPVERIHGPVLLISGGDDQLWPTAYMADRVMERLDANDFPYPHVHLCYDSAGHAVGGGPYWPTARLVRVTHPVAKIELLLGGTPEGLAHATLDSWRNILAFLDHHLREIASLNGAETAR
ncbi:MAG: acyl-CoA thioester hydrolase/BAAT C-terminal domain-containing protein [Candidatus Eisenbacteria bacterium]